jgi:alkylhydroperoxidase family enzyme
MNRFSAAVDAFVRHLLGTRGASTPAQRAAAAAGSGDELSPELADLVATIHRHAYRVTDEDIAALRARHGDDHLFELIVCAAVGAARQRLDAGLRALEKAKAP